MSAVYLLKSQGVSHRADEYVSHGGAGDGLGPDDADAEGMFSVGGDEDGEALEPEQALEKFTVNLNEEAAEGHIDPMIGRDKELERCIHVLSRRRKNNPMIFVGEAGVGKNYR